MSDPVRLTTEPWIPVETLDGHAEEVSLRDVFRRAGELRGIQADSPLEQRALERLLIAIAFRVQGDAWADGTPDGLAVDAIDHYLAEREDDFSLGRFLTHDDKPVLAAAAMCLDRLLLPDSNRPVPARLSPAETARAVLVRVLFDPSGIRTGIIGEPADASGRAAPIGPAWLSRIPTSLVHLGTLAETILWNLPAGEWGPGAPAWEDDPARPRGEHAPVGPGRLLVWPARRITLHLDADGWTTGALLTAGDRLDPSGLETVEQHGLWRPSTAHRGALRPRGGDFCLDPWFPLAAGGPLPIGIRRLAGHAVGPARIDTLTVALDGHRTTITDVRMHRLAVDGRSLPGQLERIDAWETVRDAFFFALRDLAAARARGAIGRASEAAVRRDVAQQLDGPFRAWLSGRDVRGDLDGVAAGIRDRVDRGAAGIPGEEYQRIRAVLVSQWRDVVRPRLAL
ncbi:type I-E CRISPR-associated protein Cse1/CasA [Brachybacterium sp. DNPG3]